MHYTLSSTDEDSYNRIHITIPPLPSVKTCEVTVTNLTANCNIQVLSEKDYITFMNEGKTYNIQFGNYSKLATESMLQLLQQGFAKVGLNVEVALDNCSRFIFASNTTFSIVYATYNVQMILGLYSKKDDEYPLHSSFENNIYVYRIKSVGFELSTPILYLMSNIGAIAFRNLSNDCVNLQTCTIAMRINNSFTDSMPIIASNAELSQKIPAAAVSGSTYLLVDANMHEVKLLSPMYISIYVEAVA